MTSSKPRTPYKGQGYIYKPITNSQPGQFNASNHLMISPKLIDLGQKDDPQFSSSEKNSAKKDPLSVTWSPATTNHKPHYSPSDSSTVSSDYLSSRASVQFIAYNPLLNQPNCKKINFSGRVIPSPYPNTPVPVHSKPLTNAVTQRPLFQHFPSSQLRANQHYPAQISNEKQIIPHKSKPETPKRSGLPEEDSNRMPAVSNITDRGRVRETELARYELPEWYERDKSTHLYENMCMIDSIRFTNKKFVSHSPSRSPPSSLKNSQCLSHFEQAQTPMKESTHNLSQKLDTPRSAKKWDRRIPRILQFVERYRAGDLEDDIDGDDYLSRNVGHQEVYNGGSFALQSNQNVHKKALSRKPSNVMNYDFNYFEEDEGVRQSIRISHIRGRR